MRRRFALCPLATRKGMKAALAPLLRAAMDAGLVSAELFTGEWTDVGTPERLAEINEPPDNFKMRQARGANRVDAGLDLLRKAQGL